MKWIFATLVALNLIVFAGFVGNKIMNPKKPQPQVVQAPQQPQAPQQIIINTGNGTPTTVSTNGTVTTNGVPAGSAIGKIVGRTANTVRPQRNANANNTGASPSAGSGKTYGALLIAMGLGGKIALIDTENGSGDLYAHLGDYDVCTLDAPYTVQKYLTAIEEAEQAGYSVLIIDSLSHAWAGEGGLLVPQSVMHIYSHYHPYDNL